MKIISLSLILGAFASLYAQDVTPRRWSHVPIGSHFVGTGYIYTEADIYFDPVLQAEDVTASLHTYPIAYTYSFPFLGKSSRIGLTQIYQQGSWKGLIEGEPTSTERQGWGDLKIRFAMDLMGAPPLKGKEFVAYRQQKTSETLVGAGLVLSAPTGEYYEERLINLGENRWSIRPQLGVVHSRSRWTYELTGSVWFFTENEDFWQNSTRKQDPLLSFQGHVIYTYLPGCWAALSGAYGGGAENTINGAAKDDDVEKVLLALSTGLPINRTTGVKLSWIRGETKTAKGADTDSVMFLISKMF